MGAVDHVQGGRSQKRLRCGTPNIPQPPRHATLSGVLYQNALSLQNLLEEERASSFLLPNALDRISDILDAKLVRNVLSNRDLRNDFVHYGVRKRLSPRLSPHLRLFGLVEAHTGGQSFEAIANDVEQGLNRVFDGLRDLLPRRLTPGRTS